ncbi:hypothetical protein CAEBREN_13652 [Caenorhabditis brenneri]|uniref:DUF7930 domain-containing protein n=1 Tax=Caenorhabditis brenneri TaxID=135651 RepID=G0NAD4_CAEBE|nr:hypothetical protein CAEBREN_13652 [Caenorhabditis brenneri]
MSEPFEIHGTIKKIDVTYAYIDTTIGDVYASTSALKDRYGSSDLNFLSHFRQNEEVQMLVVKQMATVTSVVETYAFAQSPKGTIFIPGDAFDKTYVSKVNKYLKVNDQVIVSFKEQYERSGCHWVATAAVKNMEMEEEELVEIAKTDKKYITGFGVVLTVDTLECEIFDERNNISVNGSLLAYTGGFRDNNTSAKTLPEIIHVNDMVMFKAEASKTPRIFTAIDWKPIIHKEELVIPTRKITAETHTQTMTDIVYKKFKNHLLEYPEEMERILPVIDYFPDSALPDAYVIMRDIEKQNAIDRAREQMNGELN